MKNLLISIFLLSIVLLFSGYFFTVDPRYSVLSPNPSGPNSAVDNNSGILRDTNSQTVEITLTLQEIAKHNGANDFWMAINGNVLDPSIFTSHPGHSVAAVT